MCMLLMVVCTVNGYVVTLDKATGVKRTSDRLPNAYLYQPVAYDSITSSLVITTNQGVYCYDAAL